MAAEDSSNARLGDDDAELLELAHDAQVAPAWVLPCQPKDQLDRLLVQGWAAVASVGIGPSASYEGTMPAKNRPGRDEEGCPPLTRDEPSEGTNERSIRPCEAGTRGLALEHGQLVAQHEDLGVLGHRVHLVDADCSDKSTDEAVEEGERHGQRASFSASCLVNSLDEQMDPSRSGWW
jgi:hypothetical protein